MGAGSAAKPLSQLLYRVATNATLNVLTRDRRSPIAPASSDAQPLEQLPAYSEHDAELLRIEYRREVFRWAARRIRNEFQPPTWEAFWLTTLQRLSIDEAANRLGKQPGAIYAARSRVMRRLKPATPRRLCVAAKPPSKVPGVKRRGESAKLAAATKFGDSGHRLAVAFERLP